MISSRLENIYTDSEESEPERTNKAKRKQATPKKRKHQDKMATKKPAMKKRKQVQKAKEKVTAQGVKGNPAVQVDFQQVAETLSPGEEIARMTFREEDYIDQ